MDFSMVPFGETSTSTATVAILTEANGLQSLELYSVPTFQRLYTLEVSPSTILIPSSQAVRFPFLSFFILGFTGNNKHFLPPRRISAFTTLSPSGKSKRFHYLDFSLFHSTIIILSLFSVSSGLEIMVKSVSESVPVHRFQHLVRKRKFEEADEFAKRFQLDRHSVLKAKLMVLLQEENPDLHLQEITQFLAEIQVHFFFPFFLSLFLSFVLLSLSPLPHCSTN